ncbi:hypothetical protein B0A50_03622 [Salinomyces thailandicus]|uniref:Uncharacterized protein n=1 Tax=Salinomyces thailandicus TaxID=706561 RepID=A0A4U0U3L8_9PEZI|nr:hypothetical protein B0A50_03622 [Salinomyces thailandica]
MPSPSGPNDSSRPIPSTPPTGFSRIDTLMTQARARISATPDLVAEIRAEALTALTPSFPPTPAELDVAERTDHAIAVSRKLAAEGQDALKRPLSAYLPAEESTVEERVVLSAHPQGPDAPTVNVYKTANAMKRGEAPQQAKLAPGVVSSTRIPFRRLLDES